MTEYLNQTKNRRKENYDFLSQIMKNHQINLEQLDSPKLSQQSSTNTDQIIKMINSKESLEQKQTIISEEGYIVQEIDTILEKVRNKYSSPKQRVKQSNQNLKLQQNEEQSDYQYQKDKQQTNRKSNKLNNYEFERISQIEEPQQIIIKIENESNEQNEQNDSQQSSAKKSRKELVKQLQKSYKENSTGKPPSYQKCPPLKENNVSPQKQIVEYEEEHDEQQDSNYLTPTKQKDGFSQLSYSQSANSIVNRSKYEYYDDKVLKSLVEEELQLMSRLNMLQQMLEYEHNIM